MYENYIPRGSKGPSIKPGASTSKLPKTDSRRLRASCDGCYLSKIKCTKETPTCTRCSNHGVVCKYSPSQRVGKPRRLRENQPVHDGSTSQDIDVGATISSNSRSTGDASVPPYSWNINFDPSITTGTSGSNLEDEISLMWPGSLSVTDSMNGGFVDDLRHDSKLSCRSNSWPTPDSDLPDTPQSSSAGLGRLGPSVVPHQPLPPLFADEHMLLPDPPARLFFSTTHDPVADAGSLSSTDHCTCAATIFDVLRTLHDQSSHTSLDQVLSANKSAVRTISTILSCHCTRDSISIMTLAVALTKIISRYQSLGGPSSQSGTNPPTDALAIAPSPTPITLGAYQLDGAEEEQVKLQVILSELRKMESLMTRYQQLFCLGPVKHETRVYHELVTFLRRRMRDIVEGLQRDLQTVYEASSL